jgi:small membrane protein
MIIKVLLLAGFALVALAAARMGPSPRHLAVRRLVAMALLSTAAAAVLLPDLVTQLAQLVGVGRGTDLVLYLFVVASAVVWLGIYRRFTEMDARITQLVRSQALAEATRPRADMGA